MSVIIKGMKMPKSCKDCPCREYPKFSFESNWCCLNQKTISDVRVISPNCPLIEIPTPHGDLVDRDDLIDEINRVTFAERYDYDVAYNIVTDAKTIIEAEVSE